MKKLLLILIVSIILVSGIYAGVGLLKTDSQISIDKTRVDKIKTTGIKDINVKASPMLCDSSSCISHVYQDNLIQTEFRTSKDYCSEYSKLPKECDNLESMQKQIEELRNQEKPNEEELARLESEYKELSDSCNNFKSECIQMTDYTPTELISMRDNFVKARLEQYADSIPTEESKSAITQIDDGGSITTKS